MTENKAIDDLEIEQPYFDKAGNQIMENDLLQVYHFRERRRRKVHYMYHVVVLEEFKGKKYWSGREYFKEGNRGHYFLRAVADKETRKINHSLIIDSADAMRDHKRK